MGSSNIDGYRIYGECYSYGRFGFTDIPKDIYLENKEILKEAKYTRRWLENKFGVEFPDISFTFSTMKNLPFNKTIELAKCLGINYIGSSIKSRPHERRALRVAIIKILTD